MSKLPRITGQEAKSAFESAGFTEDRRRGSHCIMVKEGHPYHLSIPLHAGKDLGKGLLRNQIKVAGMTVEEFLSHL